MKKKVTMICILKSGAKVEDSIKFNNKDAKIFRAIEEIQTDMEKYFANSISGKGYITFGRTTIAMSEIVAVSFAD